MNHDSLSAAQIAYLKSYRFHKINPVAVSLFLSYDKRKFFILAYRNHFI